MAYFRDSRSLFVVGIFFLSLYSCTAQPIQPFFYQGLVARAGAVEMAAESGDAAEKVKARTEAAALFEKALDNPNPHVRAAAAAELLSLYAEGEKLSAVALNHARQEAVGTWAAAFDALDSAQALQKEKALSFILGGGVSSSSGGASVPGGTFPDEAARYTLRELRSHDADFFSPAENAAIDGHIAASRSRFGEALLFFRAVLNDDEAGNNRIFLHHPALINDLGRCFQYATNSREGIDLFLEWEQNLAEGENPNVRYRLFFFAARIARQRGLFDQGIELFSCALPCAPDSEQADACIWYILDSALSRSPAIAIRHLEALSPQWHDPAYFSDILDKLSRELVAKRQWAELVNVFDLIQRSGDTESTAKYAWIIYRAFEEGYLPAAQETAATAPTETATQKTAAAFLDIAYAAGNAPSYYRAHSAAVLGKPFLETADVLAGKNAPQPQSAVMEFLLGFFNNNAAQFAPPYIRPFENELSVADLRALAEALEQAGLHIHSMRLISAYMDQVDQIDQEQTEQTNYHPQRRDWELRYPRPFKELVERYARETGVSPALLFGLVRTESAFQSGVVSSAGAVGLTQLMPATAQETAARILRGGGPDYTRTEPAEAGPDLRDPAVNIHIGAAYLAWLMERMDEPLLAILAYNGGMNRIRRWLASDRRIGALPPDLFMETIEYRETREYGRRVLSAAAAYESLYYD